MADQPVSNDEIERLLAEAGAGLPPLGGGDGPATPDAKAPAPSGPAPAAAAKPEIATAPTPPSAAKVTPAPPRDEPIASADIELLLKQAQEAIASIDQPQLSPAAAVKAFQLDEFAGAPPTTERATLELIRDVELDLRIEFGRTQMYLEDVLKLRKGSVVPLDKLAGDPVDIFVNGRLIAKGEVLVLNDNFCVRVAELIAGEQLA
jgi:flagellar motor switch protein FliN/FliY